MCRAPLAGGLTEREVEVLRSVADGLSNTEIANRLTISPRTVHAHLRSIYEKLKVNSRTISPRESPEALWACADGVSDRSSVST